LIELFIYIFILLYMPLVTDMGSRKHKSKQVWFQIGLCILLHCRNTIYPQYSM